MAILNFLDDTPLVESFLGRKVFLVPSAVVAMISCVPDISFLAKFSGTGLLAVVLSCL